MNLDKLHGELIAAARTHPPSDVVPHGFERRILNRIKSFDITDAWNIWARALWGAAAPCVAVAMLLLAWFTLTTPGTSGNSDTTPDIESTVMAGANFEQLPTDTVR